MGLRSVRAAQRPSPLAVPRLRSEDGLMDFMPAVTAAVCMAGMWKLMNKRPRMQCSRCRMYMNKHEKSCPFYREDD